MDVMMIIDSAAPNRCLQRDTMFSSQFYDCNMRPILSTLKWKETANKGRSLALVEYFYPGKILPAV